MPGISNFRRGDCTNTIFLGAYPTEETARAGIVTIREHHLYSPGLIRHPEFHVLIGRVKENELFVLSLEDYYSGYLHLFRYGAGGGNAVVNIFDCKDSAEDAIDIIRYGLKDEQGNIDL